MSSASAASHDTTNRYHLTIRHPPLGCGEYKPLARRGKRWLRWAMPRPISENRGSRRRCSRKSGFSSWHRRGVGRAYHFVSGDRVPPCHRNMDAIKPHV